MTEGQINNENAVVANIPRNDVDARIDPAIAEDIVEDNGNGSAYGQET
jgi:hypothetical protein